MPGSEEELYKPANVEKIVAWGGMASITHIVKYLQPGIDLITAGNPKAEFRPSIGREAFSSDERMREVARRVALDIGVYNSAGLSQRAGRLHPDRGPTGPGSQPPIGFGKLV